MKALERRAWRSTHQDGLFDLVLGLIMLANYVAGVSGGRYSSLVLLALTLPSAAILVVGKRLVTVPRVGLVKFGPARLARWRKSWIVLPVTILATAALVMTARNGVSWISDQHVLVSLGLGLGIFLAFGAMAFWKDFPRLYLIGAAFGGAVTATELLDTPLPLLIGGSAVLLMGLVLFIRFLHLYRLPAAGGQPQGG